MLKLCIVQMIYYTVITLNYRKIESIVKGITHRPAGYRNTYIGSGVGNYINYNSLLL